MTPKLKSQDEQDSCNTDQAWDDSQGPLTYQDLWQWLIDQGVTRNKTDGQQIRILLGLCNHTKIESE